MNPTSDFRRAWTLARRPLNAVLRARLVSALVAPRGIDGFLQILDPSWSVSRVRARVMSVEHEQGEAVSLWLAPNENWRTFRAGQFVQLSAWIDGVRQTRCFSISSAPEDGLPLRLTIKLLPGGSVSTWARRAARRGDFVELSQPMGHFTLPDPIPHRLLFISGGSGITPIVSILRHLVAREHPAELVCLHYARRAVVLGHELGALASRHAPLRLVTHLTGRAGQASAPRPRFSARALETLLPDWQAYETFLCGPPPLLQAAAPVWRERGLAGRLHVEQFTDATSRVSSLGGGARHRLLFTRSAREARGHEGASLLQQALDAGIDAPYGCRMGICQRCRCIKRSGLVRHTVTGALDGTAHQPIQLCIHAPCSDVELDL